MALACPGGAAALCCICPRALGSVGVSCRASVPVMCRRPLCSTQSPCFQWDLHAVFPVVMPGCARFRSPSASGSAGAYRHAQRPVRVQASLGPAGAQALAPGRRERQGRPGERVWSGRSVSAPLCTGVTPGPSCSCWLSNRVAGSNGLSTEPTLVAGQRAVGVAPLLVEFRWVAASGLVLSWLQPVPRRARMDSASSTMPAMISAADAGARTRPALCPA